MPEEHGNFVFDFKGKNAVVTGGASGIGKAAALLLGSLGAKVAIWDMQESLGKEVCAELEAFNGGLFFETDVTLEMQVTENARSVEKQWGRIDILICAAGVTYPYATVLESDLAGWERTININSRGVFFCNRAVAPLMIKHSWGKIVNIASIAAKTGGGILGNAIYGASKGAVISFTKGLARELAPYGINVNSICPGVTETPILGPMTGNSREILREATPLGCFAEVSDISNAIAFLCSEGARHITSIALNVDGGFMSGN